MSKHALHRSRRLGHLKVVATVMLVVAFVTLFVGGATGMIGAPGDGGGDDQAVTADARVIDSPDEGDSQGGQDRAVGDTPS